MPLDGHSFLVGQGWAGSGSGLREGAISRPLAIPQKRTLAGVGKDRDEAFPFWDHLFSAAAKSIQLKIHNSDSENDSDADDDQDKSNPTAVFSRTSTGILSNRRPVTGVSAKSSGTSTPLEVDCSRPRYSLLVTAKREAAKRNLYSMFFRGPVLGPDFGYESEALDASSTSRHPDEGQGKPGFGSRSGTEGKNQESAMKKKKRKRGQVEAAVDLFKKKREEEEGEHKKIEKSWNPEEPEAPRRRDAKRKGKVKVEDVVQSAETTLNVSKEERRRLKRETRENMKRSKASLNRDGECDSRKREIEKRDDGAPSASSTNIAPQRKKKRKRKE